ncbi:MAG: photosynthetic complex putative assembly protein PuhB [Pseudomonadota bacterium]
MSAAHHDDFAVEPIRGLPEQLPPGERILWQGAPDWRRLALRAFHVRAIALYFGAFAIWRFADAAAGGRGLSDSLVAAAPVVAPALLSIGLLSLWALLIAKTTVYTITNRRLVMRFGLALTKAINIPFNLVEQADARILADGSGDVPITLKPPNRIGYLHLWPHARPVRLHRPRPMLRAIPDAAAAATTLADALTAFAAGEEGRVARTAKVASPPSTHGSPERAFDVATAST